MTLTSVLDDKESKNGNSGGHFSELLKVEAKLALRTPFGIGLGIALPFAFLILFGAISNAVGGNVANSGYTVLDLYIPTIMVIGFTFIALVGLPNPLVRYREIGWLRRVSTTPVPPSRILAAQLIINLTFVLATILIVIFGSELIFGAALTVAIPYFFLSLILSIAEIFSLGLVVAAIVPTQTAQQAASGGLAFLLMFLAGLWVQPVQAGGILETIMYYSPSGAAVRVLLDSVFNQTPPLTTMLALVVYTIIFAFIATHYFRWE